MIELLLFTVPGRIIAYFAIGVIAFAFAAYAEKKIEEKNDDENKKVCL